MGSNDPVWNEVIAFDITTGKEPLVLEVIDWVSNRNKQPMGKIMIPLKEMELRGENEQGQPID